MSKTFIQPSHVKELEKSKDMQIYPVIMNKDGELIDGFHRKAADPNWKESRLKYNPTPINKVKIQIEANLKRRDVTKEEKQEWVRQVEVELKKQGKSMTTREIGNILGVSHKTIIQWKKGLVLVPKVPSFNRKLVSHADNTNMFYLSEINHKETRGDSYHVIKKGENYPTLKRRSWFFHEDGTEFSLREYARVQEFPDSFMFIGIKEKIKNQIGNAVPPPMAEYIAKKIPKSNAIELFAGCGGMALGFERAKHNVLWMNEFNNMACRTYHANFPTTIIDSRDIEEIKVNDIIKATNNKKIDLIFAGPPCQGFSLSGVRFKDDNRNKLYKEFIRIVKGIKPKYFVMENVQGILPFKDEIIEDFEKEEYIVNVEKVNGLDIGMKQKRIRVFFIGNRK